MQFDNDKGVMSLQNFDFLASSFAQMRSQGSQLKVEHITGNMDVASKIWFLNRYDYYLTQLQDRSLINSSSVQ